MTFKDMVRIAARIQHASYGPEDAAIEACQDIIDVIMKRKNCPDSTLNSILKKHKIDESSSDYLVDLLDEYSDDDCPGAKVVRQVMDKVFRKF